MNKLLILLVALLVAVALCACGSSGDATQPNADPTENNVTTQPNATGNAVTEPTSGTEVTDPEATTGDVENTQPDATEPSATEEPTEPTATTTPTEPQVETTEPVATEPTTQKVTYEDYYYKFTAEEQLAFINSFESIEAFFEWNTAAKEEYENNMKPINPDGSIDLGQ